MTVRQAVLIRGVKWAGTIAPFKRDIILHLTTPRPKAAPILLAAREWGSIRVLAVRTATDSAHQNRPGGKSGLKQSLWGALRWLQCAIQFGGGAQLCCTQQCLMGITGVQGGYQPDKRELERQLPRARPGRLLWRLPDLSAINSEPDSFRWKICR